jgi:hypothetical protein
VEKRDITPAMAARLVAAQFPQWADDAADVIDAAAAGEA